MMSQDHKKHKEGTAVKNIDQEQVALLLKDLLKYCRNQYTESIRSVDDVITAYQRIIENANSRTVLWQYLAWTALFLWGLSSVIFMCVIEGWL